MPPDFFKVDVVLLLAEELLAEELLAEELLEEELLEEEPVMSAPEGPLRGTTFPHLSFPLLLPNTLAVVFAAKPVELVAKLENGNALDCEATDTDFIGA